MPKKPEEPLPPGLEGPGGAFWAEMLASYQFSPAERVLLLEAARTVDILDRLSAPQEARQARMHRLALVRILAALRLPENEGESWTARRAAKAARARWSDRRTS